MNRGDFSAGIEVRQKSDGQIMLLGGTEDDWICTFTTNGKFMTLHVDPEDVDPVLSTL